MNETKTNFNREECLALNPFDGDYGDGEVTLRNKIAVARKQHECHNCSMPIAKGETIRLMVERVYNELATYRWCNKCCKAMALASRGKPLTWFNRAEIRFRKPFDMANERTQP